jgi:SAM-dependent methyltransferase
MATLAMNSATGKRLLSVIRESDYAHPGEEEANRLLFAGLSPDPGRRVLDAGCGSGGTAAWVQAQGLGIVTGLEVDADTARLARERHPDVTIVEGDVQRAPEALAGPYDLAYAMTAFYAVPDKAAAFSQLAALAAPAGELRLLEYADPDGRFSEAPSSRTSFDWWQPLRPAELPALLVAAGWRLNELRDLTPQFVRWYDDLCRRIDDRREAIVEGFGSEWYDFVAAEYAALLSLVREGSLGGLLARASRAVEDRG